MSNDQINGAEPPPQLTLEMAIQKFGDAFIGSRMQGNNLNIDLSRVIPQLMIMSEVTRITLDMMVEMLCNNGGDVQSFRETLAERLIKMAEAMPKPSLLQLAGAVPGRRN